MSKAARISRRAFLQRSTMHLAVPAVLAASSWGVGGCAAPPSRRITVGCVGLGAQGFDNLRQMLLLPEVQVVAVCDVASRHFREQESSPGTAYGREPACATVDARYAEQQKSGLYKACAAYADFRELCARDDIDAVVVSTPDHWHALCALEALRNKKDVYCEKPLTHCFGEGALLCREVARHKAILQTGSQQRSAPLFRRAVDTVRNGAIGRLRRIEIGLPDGYSEPMGDVTVQAPPADLDYDLWTGPAPLLPYMRARHHRWWRGHRAYGGGTLMDWIGHHNDIGEWGLGPERPRLEQVAANDWVFPETSIYDTPVNFEIRCQYAGGVETSIADRHPQGVKWIGDAGWLYVTRWLIEASDPRLAAVDYQPGRSTLEPSTNHHRNFIDAVKSRRQPIAPAEIGLRAITPGFLGYVSQALQRAVRWDEVSQAIVDDPEADALLRRVDYRAPWTL